jgi:hypothetical protein
MIRAAVTTLTLKSKKVMLFYDYICKERPDLSKTDIRMLEVIG